jgi:hypothetical protein
MQPKDSLLRSQQPTTRSYPEQVKWVSCDHGMAYLQAAYAGDSLQVWRLAVVYTIWSKVSGHPSAVVNLSLYDRT